MDICDVVGIGVIMPGIVTWPIARGDGQVLIFNYLMRQVKAKKTLVSNI